MRAIASVAEHGVTRAQKHNGPGERSNECARDIDSRSSSRGKVVEDRTRNHGADDTQSEVQHDTFACTLKEPEDYVACDKSEKNTDNN
jgi:hypothetical protein